MKHKDKTKDQLMREVLALRQRIAELECSEVELHEKIASSSENNGKYYDLFKNARDALYITDRDGRIVDANQSCLNLLGYTREELKNLKVQETYAHHNDRRTFQQTLEHKGSVNDYAVRLLRKDGRELDCLITATVRRTNDGSVLGYHGIIRDITEYTSMKKKIQENERRYQELADLLPLAVFEADESGNFFFINRQGFKLSGYTPQDLDNGLNALQFFIPEDRDGVRQDMRRILSGEKLGGREYRGLKKDGSTYPVIMYTDPIIIDHKARGVRGVVLDVSERKQVEKKLRINKSTIASSINAIAIADLEGNLTYVNPSFLTLWGYEREEEITGSPAFKFWQKPEEALEVLGALREKGGWVGELIAQRKDGSEFYVQLAANMVTDETGNPLCMMGSFVDITKRKKAQKELLENKERFRVLVEATSDWIWEVDQNGVYTYVSPKVKDLLGYEPEEIIGKKPCDLMPPEEAERIGALFQDIVVSHKALERLENVNLHKNGRRVVLETSGIPIFDEQENFVGYRGIDRDITDRKQAEQDLRESRILYYSLFDNTPVGIGLTTIDGHILIANQVMHQMTGYSEAGMGNLNMNDIYTNIKDRTLLLKQVLEGEPVRDFTVSMKRKDGSSIDVSLTINRITIDGKDTFLTMIRDITTQIKAKRKLQDYQNRLRSLANELSLTEERERRRIATSLHDHIGHSLAMCKIKVGLLRESLPPKHRNGYVAEIKEIIEHVIQHTRSLTFELSPPVLYEMGLTAALEWLAEDISKQHGIQITVHHTKQFKKLNGNLEILIFQAARELLANIVKHAQAHNVEISIQRYNTTVEMDVKDDGVGFDTARLLSNITDNGGFGLFNIRERFDHLGGYCDIQSQPGSGTRVTISAPLKTTE